ncbi:solute carrier family 25 (mitochondrial carnitine/acylcarnitine transporter), member 20/29 [Cryptococcus neoformans C23]|uniref:Solute carrier family 25 (Mitochondrial carnitine/acylcarnitine transporter), member 20/29 n=2 Tax=Cryptococcus neoformans TaxID=5207 RepID=A0A854Q6I7_CRYNE|nr:solute carrier family 25 (mitochondrial carnitine/acylcarnitine transporter), member 20/29 [Cryptococcus neoformans var. grubii H99]AUB26547.1 solute carrier family 25 (mitochondrial carnitine/acylcarnitine transporter), member 20/29 [Cryptococcus neoformans var. grubii]OWZ29700.1 solute carrier family 25 (mitochondrial carnitine/acylcarnitine transporter), member 20/29 [Cryptococcus neoformans var. grubii AD2-60a]OWZ37650.1 solute carrier family 25 (mitochondrial carnitine/acylcarnitine tran|eukprot:XP_012050936.1 solute carrier family 25 (mitochondrial carnitine/acylcarnitine transporter), member 20/29 [Cryptococcus neoformans var. grubii H99]
MSELLSPPPDAAGVPLTQTQKDLVGGSVGGIAQVLVGQPFDIVKVRVQTAPPGTYSSPIDCASKLLKADGLLGFYKGTLTPLLGIGACVSIQFGALEWAKRLFAQRARGRDLNLAEFWLSGAFAGVANTVVSNPVEHIRIRLQTQPDTLPRMYNGPLDCAIKLYKSGGGLKGVFKGQVPTMLRDGVGYGCYFLAYEALVQRHLRATNLSRDQISPLWAVTYGAAAGYALWFSIYPVDVIKSKLQTDSLDPTKQKFKGLIDCTRQTWRAQGMKGFLGGLAPTLIRSPFANGATFVAFELAMRAMN